MTGSSGLKAYTAVTAAYWTFMLTDGALRMLVLLHFHGLEFSPVQLAYLFLLYELAGVVTNLSAGWIAARFGLSTTLRIGLALQIIALIALTRLSPDWAIAASVWFVMSVQGLSGVAKDLAKMSSKSAVKLLAPDTSDGLFRWVAFLTGSKNAIKGAGFFLGAALLAMIGYSGALWAMAAVLSLVFLAILIAMPAGLPAGRASTKFSQVWSTSSEINRLSAARLFLFGARDVWFVVGIPIYMQAAFSNGTPDGDARAFFFVGGFMALWIILYGAVQAAAPKLLNAAHKTEPALIREAGFWVWSLVLLLAPLTIAAIFRPSPEGIAPYLVIIGLLGFGALFAINSSLHSYLVLAFSKSERVTMDVGFYYMANAAGRFLGTLLSGISYQLGGLPVMLATATVLVLISSAFTARLSK